MMRWKGNRKRQTVRQRWTCTCTSVREAVRSGVGPTVAMLTGFVMVVGGHGTWTAVAESPHFRLKRVEVAGAATIPEAEVLAACGLVPGGTRVLGLDTSDVALACESDPRIRSARIESFLPDHVQVRIEEEHPVLAVATDKGVWLVNQYSEAYAPWDPMDVVDLPLLVGSCETASDVERAPLLREAVALLRSASRDVTPWQGLDLVIEHDPSLGFSIVPASRGMAARFGAGPFPRKMKRLKAALAVVKERGLPVAEAYLDDRVRPDHVTLRLGGFGPFADADRGDRTGGVP